MVFFSFPNGLACIRGLISEREIMSLKYYLNKAFFALFSHIYSQSMKTCIWMFCHMDVAFDCHNILYDRNKHAVHIVPLRLLSSWWTVWRLWHLWHCCRSLEWDRYSLLSVGHSQEMRIHDMHKWFLPHNTCQDSLWCKACWWWSSFAYSLTHSN